MMGNTGAHGSALSQPGGRGAFVTYTISSEKAGLVIRKGGEGIKEINPHSSAHVRIQRSDKMGAAPSDPGPQRVINVSNQHWKVEEVK